jgi:hypothetical protein
LAVLQLFVTISTVAVFHAAPVLPQAALSIPNVAAVSAVASTTPAATVYAVELPAAFAFRSSQRRIKTRA